jgi:hypothetical protein
VREGNFSELRAGLGQVASSFVVERVRTRLDTVG